MNQWERLRREPPHVRDVSRSEREVQRCKCGYVTRTVDEMRRHIAEPEPEESPRQSLRSG